MALAQSVDSAVGEGMGAWEEVSVGLLVALSLRVVVDEEVELSEAGAAL